MCLVPAPEVVRKYSIKNALLPITDLPVRLIAHLELNQWDHHRAPEARQSVMITPQGSLARRRAGFGPLHDTQESRSYCGA